LLSDWRWCSPLPDSTLASCRTAATRRSLPGAPAPSNKSRRFLTPKKLLRLLKPPAWYLLIGDAPPGPRSAQDLSARLVAESASHLISSRLVSNTVIPIHPAPRRRRRRRPPPPPPPIPSSFLPFFPSAPPSYRLLPPISSN
jgi:hypothetical protein